MRKFILCLTFFCLCTAAFAQDTLRHTSRFSISYSSSIPVGDFRSTTYETDYPPFATDGGLLQLSYAYGLKYNLYAGATLGWRRNPFSFESFLENDDELVLSKKSKPWQSLLAMADVQYLLHARDGFAYIKGYLGASFNSTNTLHIVTPYGTINHTAAKATALAYGVSAGAQINIRNFGIGLDTGILSTRPTFERITAQGTSVKYKQPITTLQFGLFAAYTL
ncbi:hypothetical protein ABID22_003330 [Pontibacter aydingkolensis]|uniref:Outer membrane protein beta-barrel domain-containing protein n=1 Tax=Pontibacter aydingkolensis TaxID=1911536 RepID=A0ABS7CUQ1_9BACT|nr:hypothetical protein [Pontibacter aydingkolensis]MBW7467401.1 hypothetical protein [Pontibacter aydingkolensis]